jgi:hypothetical protein
MPLVTEGIALPSVLRLLPVELLPDEPWWLPLGALAPLPTPQLPGPAASPAISPATTVSSDASVGASPDTAAEDSPPE